MRTTSLPLRLSLLLSCDPGSTKDADGDGWEVDDCDPADPAVHPDAEELCNGRDDNCDVEVDEGLLHTLYVDDDRDGYGDPSKTAQVCESGPGYSSTAGDCDDSEASVYPAAPELCDGMDNDCDGDGDAGVEMWWYDDSDGDGWGDPAISEFVCLPRWGWVDRAGDCAPRDPSIHPEAPERCNDLDDDCDDELDEGFDEDGDGFLPLKTCPSGSDCDDADSTIYPDAPETCGDGEDQDCDGVDTSCRFGGAYDPDDATFSLSATSQTAGIGMESGDVDGDGLTEVVVLAGPFSMGLYGAWVVNGPLTETTDFDSVSCSLYGQDFGTPTANALGMGDANGDGLIDVLLGASSDDKAYLVLGPIVADLDLADADALLFGESNTRTGNAVELGDLNGDGLADALLGAFWYSSRGARSISNMHLSMPRSTSMPTPTPSCSGPRTASRVSVCAPERTSTVTASVICWSQRRARS